jgi:hypothetical protein
MMIVEPSNSVSIQLFRSFYQEPKVKIINDSLINLLPQHLSGNATSSSLSDSSSSSFSTSSNSSFFASSSYVSTSSSPSPWEDIEIFWVFGNAFGIPEENNGEWEV